jgi:large subunit ribosomal protein L5
MSAPRLKQKYDGDVIKALQEEFQYGNPHEVPRIVKIVANMGLGEAV